ncbi:MAG: InlB B-repeat-containing protein [Defluviitaleaceae bacterium]|nr:InlB B-repeat-containing protein [Defluviitaleaceae bacterium]
MINQKKRSLLKVVVAIVLLLIMGFSAMTVSVLAVQAGDYAITDEQSDDTYINDYIAGGEYLSCLDTVTFFSESRVAPRSVPNIFIVSNDVSQDGCCWFCWWNYAYVALYACCCTAYWPLSWVFPHLTSPLNRLLGFRDVVNGTFYHFIGVLPRPIHMHPRVLTPVWRDIPYVLHFDANGGYMQCMMTGTSHSYIRSQVLGNLIPLPGLNYMPITDVNAWDGWSLASTELTRDNYVFVGWLSSSSGNIYHNWWEVDTQTICSLRWDWNATGEEFTTTFTAVWAPATTLTFDANGGTPATQTLTRGAGQQVGTLPPPPTRDGFVFGGWFSTPTATGAQITATSIVPNTDTTFWARWEVVLTFDANGGTPATQTIARVPGSRIGNPLPPNPTRTGYIFAGWFTTPDATGGTRVTDMSWTPNIATTYWARWVTSITVYYENLVSLDTLAARNQADASIDEIKHLFLTNFGVNLVQASPARHEPGLVPGLSPSNLLNVSRSSHDTVRFRFIHFGIGVAGIGRSGSGWNANTSFHLGEMAVTTILDPVALRFTVVHEISHVFGAWDCSGAGCVMNFFTPRAEYSNWCGPCRTRMHNYLSFIWLTHLSYFAPGGNSAEFSYHADNLYYIEPLEAACFYTPN